MNTILIFVLCLAILIGLIWGALKFFTYLLKTRQAPKPSADKDQKLNK